MTRVCVTWDREETARLVARCRAALAVSDETAKAASADGQCPYLCDADCSERCHAVHDVPLKTDHRPEGCPSTRLALNRALRAVLVGIAATLGDGYQSRYEDVEHAQASLAAIAAALGQEEGS